MYIDYTLWETFEYTISSLLLDPKNPRLKHRAQKMNQTQIMQYLLENEKIYELAKKISEEGYYVGEEPIICIENDKKIVLEGNRRTAALKLLQDPAKYLSVAKAKVLLKNVVLNDFPIDKKQKVYIAPNRLQANPIIYERHNGFSLQRWETGNQYAFVAEMYYVDGLTIDDICDVLNQSRAKIIKPLKAYNLFMEGQAIVKRDLNIDINVTEFEFTNLERFYNYEAGRDFLGIDFDADDGQLIIKIKRSEFEKRLLEVFKSIIDAERFSRDFNKEEDKENFISTLRNNPIFDFSSNVEEKSQSRGEKNKSDLEAKKNNTTSRRKKGKNKSNFENKIIAGDTEIIFDNAKLDALFTELKHLALDKVYSFSILLRTYLEQSLYYYLTENDLFDSLSDKTNQDTEKYNLKKVSDLIKYLETKNELKGTIDSNELMKILRFTTKKDYSNASLKIMLDYVKNNCLDEHLDANKLKNLKHYIDNIKEGLDLAVHNIETIVDIGHNKRAWTHLEPLFVILSNNIKKD